MNPDQSFDMATLAIHADDGVERMADVSPALHLSTTFRADNEQGLVYSRDDQPTRRRLEAVLGAMERGQAVVYGSGQAATHAALRSLAPQRVAIDRGYYGTHDTLSLFDREGVSVMGLDADLHRGDVVWLETPKNPCCEIEDIAFHAERARRSGAHVVVDSTLATPVLQRPLSLGADVVMHSSSKYLAGHSDALGGVLVTGNRRLACLLREQREILGAVPGSLETWLTLRSLRTLALRVERQSDTAAEIARWLEPRVARVWHPSLSSHPGFELGRRQMRGGGGLLSFELDDAEKAKRLPQILGLFQDATSLGGVESLIEWRHKHDRKTSPQLLRVSVGLEAPEDLIDDLRRGLAAL